MTKDFLNKIIALFRDGKITNIKKIKILMDIFSYINKKKADKNDMNQINNNYNYILFIIQLNSNKFEKNYLLLDNQCPLYFENNYLISKITKLKLLISKETDYNKLEEKNIIFTPEFNEMIELIHFGICTGTSLIFEGFPGQGKKRAVNFISGLINYEVENIIITSNFSVKDLFKKRIVENNNDGTVELVEVETKLYDKLFNKENENKFKKNILFIFHNINQAESDVLSKISELFNENHREDNSYLLIGFINIKENLKERNLYYYNYFSNLIYYIVKNTNIELKFLDKIIPDNLGIQKSLILKYYQNNNQINNIFTLSDIIKFIKLKKNSFFDDTFLEEIVFKNRIQQKEMLTNNSLNLDFNYRNGFKKELIIEVNDKFTSIETNNIYNEFEEEKNTLSFEQKKCLIFLGLAVKSNIPCILQGETGIGKSHLIKLFAKFLGKKLHILELNKDNDISLLSKNCFFKEYNDEERKEINEELTSILEEYNINCENLELNKKYEKVIKIKKIKNIHINKINKLKKKYNFINRLK